MCRHFDCDLTYSSQQEDRINRLMRKARKIREQLGVDAPLAEPILFKPKNIHWNAFNRLRAEEGRERGILA